jgi:hypothetical protein
VSNPVVYVVDTSAIIDLDKWFRKSTFPSLWEKLRSFADHGIFCCPREVKRELEQKSDELARCISNNKIVVSEEVTLEIVNDTAAIDKKYPQLKVGKRRSQPNPRSADPWIVALALKRKATVVSSEEPQPAATEIRTIPDACLREGIKCLSLPELFEELNISI